MADERIYLHHPKSGQYTCIGKRFGIIDGYGASAGMTEQLNDFYNRCSEHIVEDGYELDYDDFRVVTEKELCKILNYPSNN